jgi:DNA (cytosine-5)-methyltransferase 1
MSKKGRLLFRIIENHPNDSRVKFSENNTIQTLSSSMGTGGGNVPLVLQEPILLESNQNHATIQTNGISTSLPASMGMGGGYVPMITDNIKESIVYRGDSITSPVNASNPKPESCHTLTDDSRNYLVEKEIDTVVRRLTPLECERLQGYPDGWTDIGEWIDTKGKKHKDADSPRYKALGNSIALPFWQWMAERMTKILKDDGIKNPTMASLFDGIGGFPLVYSRCGVVPVWASEIEEFPIAVTKIHFGEEL